MYSLLLCILKISVFGALTTISREEGESIRMRKLLNEALERNRLF